MTETLAEIALPPLFPDHTQLPESDGTFVKNFQEHPQSLILTDSIGSLLQRLHPDGQYCIGQDCGIYWRETDPPEKGAEAPDWFYVPDVPPRLDGEIRRPYVLWREYITPTIALEFASGDGSEERDTTPLLRSAEEDTCVRRSPPLSKVSVGEVTKPGKFWVYERVMRIPFYAIYQINNSTLEVYHLIEGVYQPMIPNERGHYPIAPIQVELGLWRGVYLNNPEQLWLRWWDLEGNLLLIGKEEAQIERQGKEQECQKRQLLTQKLRSLSPEQLRELGIEPEMLA